MTLRILLLDDHQMLVEALAARLSDEPDLLVSTLGSATGEAAIAHAMRVRPDVVVLEVAPLDDDRRELVTLLRGRLADARLVVLSGDDDPDIAAEAVALGADGWISKESTTGEVIEMIRAAGRGRPWLPPRQFGAALSRLHDEARGLARPSGPLDALTGREREILAAMMAGQPATSIAACLRVSANTVRTHVSSVYDKLGVHSRLAAVAAARSAGLTPVPVVARGTVLPFASDALVSR